MQQDRDVLIIGGGPIGLAFGHAPGRRQAAITARLTGQGRLQLPGTAI